MNLCRTGPHHFLAEFNVPNLGYIYLSRGTFKIRNRRENAFIDYLFRNIYIYQWILYWKIIMYLLINMLTLRHKTESPFIVPKIWKLYRKFSGFLLFLLSLFVIWILGVHAHLSQCWSGTYGQRKVGNPWPSLLVSLYLPVLTRQQHRLCFDWKHMVSSNEASSKKLKYST